ncbi:hypothetical protein [Demequina sp. NBRC 110055]|uniref:hypothetical protein n=1 Tax=Demequina sp. NBRC 110055 TaxID=1570344 RepID=UPI0009FD603B|nr:hypothetical protein [Demequina sp. NBRC 110055]
MSDWWPVTGSVRGHVASLGPVDAESMTRVFLPIEGEDDVTLTWREVAGVDALDPEVRFQELVPDYEERDVFPWSAAVPVDVVERLLAALADAGLSGPVDLVGWDVYAEDRLWRSLGARSVEFAYGATRWHDGDHARLAEQPLESLLSWAGNMAFFPVAVIPASHEWMIGAPGYSDSLYVSGPWALRQALEERGLEVATVDRRSTASLPSDQD